MGLQSLIHKPALFFDRDGVLADLVLNPKTGSYEAAKSADQLNPCQESIPLLRALQENYKIFVITNQPDAAKLKCTHQDLDGVRSQFLDFFAMHQIQISDYYECRHHPEALEPELRFECDCRKPKPGMIFSLAKKHAIDLANSWVIGDQDTDIQCAQAAGCQSILLINSHSNNKRFGQIQPDYTVHNLAEVYNICFYKIQKS